MSACCGTFGVSYGNLAAGNGFSFTYGNGNGQLTLSDGSSLGQITVNQPYQLSDGNWHLFDLVYTGTTATFYVDGAPVGSDYLGGLTTDTSIGLTASSQYLDEVAVYPAALSAARIAAHWTQWPLRCDLPGIAVARS